MKNLYDLPDEIEGLDIHAVDVQFVKDNRFYIQSMLIVNSNLAIRQRHRKRCSSLLFSFSSSFVFHCTYFIFIVRYIIDIA